MNTRILHPRVGCLALAAASCFLLGRVSAEAQCTEILSDLQEPIDSLLTDQGNLLISESGDATPGSGRISIVDPGGNRRTLLGGLPSAPADVGDPSGPTGIVMRGRNLMC